MDDRDRKGEGVRIVPPPRARPISSGSGGARPPRPVPWGSLVLILLLLLLVIATFVVVPRWAEAPVAAPPAASPEPLPAEPARPAPGATVASPEELREMAYRKEHADELGNSARELDEALRAREVGLWAGDAHADAVRHLHEGEEAVAARRFADAESEYRAALAGLQAIDAGAVDVLRRLLQEGAAALRDGDAVAAAAAFRLAGKVSPGDPSAAAGARRAAALDQVLDRLRAGRRLELDGDLAGAERLYAEAVRLDPMSPEAQKALARAQGRQREDAFAQVMSEGLLLLDEREWAGARAAFQRAEAMQPGSPQVAEAMAQVDEGEKLETIARSREAAAELEAREDWAGAVREYESVLAIDATLQFAVVGLDRCRRRADLAARIDYDLAHPDRLSAEAVLTEAVQLLDDARQVDPAGPRHLDQVERLDRLIGTFAKPVQVTLESDNRTEVTIHQVGRLGTFERTQLELRPGRYTVVGTRRGYRDVRRTLEVVPGAPPAPLDVRCEEEI